MAVRDRKSTLGISGYYGIVSVYFCSFFYCILDIRSGFLHCQVIPGIAPVVSGIQGDFFSLFLVACIKLHFDFCRAFSILVVSILPCLAHMDAGLSRLVFIGDRCSGDLRSVIRYSILTYSIRDHLSVLIFIQTFKAVLPVGGFCYFLAVYLCSICQKIYCDAGWTFSILVTCIVPDLLALHLRFFRGMAVRDRKSALGISGYYGIVFGYLCSFFYCILDIRSGFFHCQVIPGIAPVVSNIQGNFLSLFLFARIKLHFDFCRAFSILIVYIVPDFFNTYCLLLIIVIIDVQCIECRIFI